MELTIEDKLIMDAEFQEIINKLNLYKKCSESMFKCIFYQQAVDAVKMVKALEKDNLIEALCPAMEDY